MSVLLTDITWYPVDTPTVGTSILDAIDVTGRKGLDIQNNILDITLKNANQQYVSELGIVKFKEKDKFKVYAKLSTDGADVNNNNWQTDDTLVGSYIMEEYNSIMSSNNQRIKVTAVDQIYLLFNRVFAKSYGVASKYTAPGIFRSVVRLNANSQYGEFGGTGNDLNCKFDIDAKFTSESGYILDTRTKNGACVSSALSGSINSTDATITVASTSGFNSPDGTLVIETEHIYYAGISGNSFTGCVRGIDDTVAASHTGVTVYEGFPLIMLSFLWEPIFKWVSEVGQVYNTNYSSEIPDSLFYQRSFILWLDSNNRIHWAYADDGVDSYFITGTDDIIEHNIEKVVFDSVNFVIYNAGDDMYGNGTTWYWYDPTTRVPDLKMKYQPMTDIAKKYIDDDIKINTVRDATPINDIYKQFPASYGPITTWSFKDDSNRWRQQNNQSLRTTLSNDTEYNDSLREACKYKGQMSAMGITSKTAGLRYKGTITMRLRLINPGDLINLTNAQVGLNAQNLRVQDVSYNLSTGTVSVTVEEDQRLRA